MLVLTRKKSQLIQIGDNIVIKVIRTGPGSVKLGIDAPSHIRVMRGELDEQLSQQYLDEQAAPQSSRQRESAQPVGAEVQVERRNLETIDEDESVSPKAGSYRHRKASII